MNSSQKSLTVPSHKSFHDLIPRYFQEEVLGIRSPLTVVAKKNDLRLFMRFLHERNGELVLADQWLPMDTRAFLDQLTKDGYAPATRNRALATLRAFSNWLISTGVIIMNPVKGIRDLQLEALVPRAIRDREWYRIQRAAELLSMNPEKSYAQGFRNKAVLAALNTSGLRISELLGLKIDQFVGRKLVNVLCKGGKVRTILIAKDAAEIISAYIGSYRINGSEYLFTNRFGQQLSRNGIADALHKIAAHASANLPSDEVIELSPHLLRHRHAFKARSVHGDVWAAKRLGHSSLKHLERYSMMTDEEEESLLERI